MKIPRVGEHAQTGRPGPILPAILALALGASAVAGFGAPVSFPSGSGRFDIAASDARVAQPVVAAADEVWRMLENPLRLPPAFSSPIYVRVLPPGSAGRPHGEEVAETFEVAIEPGGIVSLRLDGAGSETALRRGLVRALLGRLAVWQYGARSALSVPPWLETACEATWRARAEPAQLDALKQESAMERPPAIDTLLRASHDDAESRGGGAGAFWLMTFLRAEAEHGTEWQEFLGRLLGGEEAEEALVASYPGRFANAAEREFWWQTGWYHHCRMPTLPARDAAESRAIVADAARFVFMRGDREVVVALPEWPELARSADGRAAMRAHAARLTREVLALHPFYRNAALALGRVLAEAETGTAEMFSAAQTAFDADWRAGSELEAATAHALDALEATR